MLAHWLNRFRGRFSGPRVELALAAAAAPQFERLESRELLSASFDSLTGALILTGSNSSDRITVYADGDGRVRVRGVTGVSNGTLFQGVRSIEIDAGKGNDCIHVENLNDPDGDAIDVVVLGGAGNDTILTGDGDDFIDGGDGKNWIASGAGDDEIITGTGHDFIDGGSGDDIIDSGLGHDKIFGGSGSDFIDAGDGNNIIDGGSGSDIIIAGLNNDLIFGGSGDDSIDAGEGTNKLDGGSDDDTLIAGSGKDTILGGEGDDVIDAGDGRNFVDAGAGEDDITTGSGNDTIYTGPGADTVDAGAGSNRIDKIEHGWFVSIHFGAPAGFFTAKPPFFVASVGSYGFGFSSGYSPVHSSSSPYSFTAIFRF